MKGGEDVLTPRDIHEAEFKVVWRGYSPQEVDEFLGKLVKKYEELCQENEDLKASLKELEARLDEYSRMELTIVDTLETAKRTTENLRAVAEREREAILEEARVRAETILQRARERAQEAVARLEALQREGESFRFRFRTLLEQYLTMLEDSGIGQEQLTKAFAETEVASAEEEE
jgi:cell division initiation protein